MEYYNPLLIWLAIGDSKVLHLGYAWDDSLVSICRLPCGEHEVSWKGLLVDESEAPQGFDGVCEKCIARYKRNHEDIEKIFTGTLESIERTQGK